MNARRFGCLVLALVFIGCGPAADPNRETTVPVTGTVTYSGEPVEGAMVTFVTGAAEGRGAFGTTDASGKFSLMTYVAGDGAVPGSYRVKISKTVMEGAPSEEEIKQYDEKGAEPPFGQEKDMLPAKYKNEAESGLTAEVKEGAENNFPFELTD